MKTTVWILGDQLLAKHPALEKARELTEQAHIRVLLIESNGRFHKLPYQRKKLVLLLSAMRHYAEELESQGYTVDYVKSDSFTSGILEHVEQFQPDQFICMESGDWNGRFYQTTQLPNRLKNHPTTQLNVLKNTQFLTGRFNPFPNHPADKKVIQEYFYREMRKHFDILMDDSDEPAGGDWNFDKENRKPLPKEIEPPPIKQFEPDKITKQVMEEVAEFDNHVGTVNDFSLAVTRQQAEKAFEQFMVERFEQFGPYEDAMSEQHHTIFHSVISPYLNIGLLEPLALVHAAEKAYREGNAPINSVEGFVRQIIGWREYMYWQYWRQMPEMAHDNEWDANRDVPPFFWSGKTEMNCLKTVLNRAISTGYNHHIERLMILSNFAVLAGLNPQQVNDWFLTFYIDAYEWVMIPNVIGMGLNADGGKTATKPYISSANYINKMSDFCKSCRYNHKQRHGDDACPFNFLYWNFLLQHEEKLRANPRLGRNVLGLRHLDEGERTAVKNQARTFLSNLDQQEKS